MYHSQNTPNTISSNQENGIPTRPACMPHKAANFAQGRNIAFTFPASAPLPRQPNPCPAGNLTRHSHASPARIHVHKLTGPHSAHPHTPALSTRSSPFPPRSPRQGKQSYGNNVRSGYGAEEAEKPHRWRMRIMFLEAYSTSHIYGQQKCLAETSFKGV